MIFSFNFPCGLLKSGQSPIKTTRNAVFSGQFNGVTVLFVCEMAVFNARWAAF